MSCNCVFHISYKLFVLVLLLCSKNVFRTPVEMRSTSED